MSLVTFHPIRSFGGYQSMQPRVVALMGATGSGKSSMIKLATGNEDIAIGHRLTSETQSIAAYSLNCMGYDITLIDTPGFDDTYRSDAEILQSIVEWLTRTYQDGTRLSGILYLHRITDVRMHGSALRNLRVFRELCGADCFKNIALCPTFWDVAEEADSVLEARLKELTNRDGYWGPMIACGSKVFEEPLTRKQVIDMLYNFVNKDTVTLQVQREVVEEQKSPSNTSAFGTLARLKLDRQQQEHEEMMAEAKRKFEQERQRRRRTHWENLAGMSQSFEARLATMEDTNQKLQADVRLGEEAAVQPVSKKLSSSPTSPTSKQKIPRFREILAIKSPADRIKMYESTRRTFADMNTGLSDWLSGMLAQQPELVPSFTRHAEGMDNMPPISSRRSGVPVQSLIRRPSSRYLSRKSLTLKSRPEKLQRGAMTPPMMNYW